MRILLICFSFFHFSFAFAQNESNPPSKTQVERIPTQEEILKQDVEKEFDDRFSDYDSTDFTWSLLRMLGILVLMILALFGLSWLTKYFITARTVSLNQDSAIKVLHSRQISSKLAVHLIDVDGSQFAIAESPTTMISLGKIFSSLDEIETKKNERS